MSLIAIRNMTSYTMEEAYVGSNTAAYRADNTLKYGSIRPGETVFLKYYGNAAGLTAGYPECRIRTSVSGGIIRRKPVTVTVPYRGDMAVVTFTDSDIL